jgi:hypothetical protein
MRPARLLLPLAALLLLLPPSAAAGDGPPTEADAGPKGVLDPSSGDRLTASPAGVRHTVLARTRVDGGEVWGTSLMTGRWGVPVVAWDGTSGGLSQDGRRLVLMQLTYRADRKVTRFAVVGAHRLHVRQRIALEGHWNFDALSPDASTLYLVQSLAPRKDLTRYAVRAYDLRAHRLLPKPIVDPSEPDEPMRGYPATRTTSLDGRWEYTLYVGGHDPFIHALDTVRRTSICIDLPRRAVKPRRMWSLKLQLRRDKIAVVDHHHAVATVARHPHAAAAGGGPPWLAALAAAAGLLALARVRPSRFGRRPR